MHRRLSGDDLKGALPKRGDEDDELARLDRFAERVNEFARARAMKEQRDRNRGR
jgi:hypothetical protein